MTLFLLLLALISCGSNLSNKSKETKNPLYDYDYSNNSKYKRPRRITINSNGFEEEIEEKEEERTWSEWATMTSKNVGKRVVRQFTKDAIDAGIGAIDTGVGAIENAGKSTKDSKTKKPPVGEKK